MSFYLTTLIALAFALVLFSDRPGQKVWVLGAALPMGAAAAFNLPAVGGASILVADFLAFCLFGHVLLRRGGPQQVLGTLRPGKTGFWLVILVVYCLISALFFPRLFAGMTDTFSVARTESSPFVLIVPLHASTGNITQFFRVFVGCLAFLALATTFRVWSDDKPVMKMMAVATMMHFALGWLDVLSHAVGLPDLLDILRTSNYAMLDHHVLLGMKRMVGGFPEASAFGSLAVGIFAFWLHHWVVSGERRSLLMFLAALLLLVRSTSSGAYVSAAGFLLVYGAVFAVTRVRRDMPLRSIVILCTTVFVLPTIVASMVAAYYTAPGFQGFADTLLFNKLDSESGEERMGWNAQAMQNFYDTYGIGAGLGSIRASSWLTATLGSLGVIGTALFFIFLTSVALLPAGDGNRGKGLVIQSIKFACLALFIRALVARPTPDLEVFFFALAGLATGLSRSVAWQKARAGRVVSAAPPGREAFGT